MSTWVSTQRAEPRPRPPGRAPRGRPMVAQRRGHPRPAVAATRAACSDSSARNRWDSAASTRSSASRPPSEMSSARAIGDQPLAGLRLREGELVQCGAGLVELPGEQTDQPEQPAGTARRQPSRSDRAGPRRCAAAGPVRRARREGGPDSASHRDRQCDGDDDMALPNLASLRTVHYVQHLTSDPRRPGRGSARDGR